MAAPGHDIGIGTRIESEHGDPDHDMRDHECGNHEHGDLRGDALRPQLFEGAAHAISTAGDKNGTRPRESSENSGS